MLIFLKCYYAVIFTDALVQRGRGVKFCLAFTVRFKGQTITEGYGAVELTASRLLKSLNHHEIFYADWIQFISGSTTEQLILVFTPCYAVDNGKSQVDSVAGDTDDNRQQTHARPTYCYPVRL